LLCRGEVDGCTEHTQRQRDLQRGASARAGPARLHFLRLRAHIRTTDSIIGHGPKRNERLCTSGFAGHQRPAAGSCEREQPAAPTGRSHHAVRACAFIGNGPKAGGGIRRLEAAS
jgi:hypothetical protein